MEKNDEIFLILTDAWYISEPSKIKEIIECSADNQDLEETDNVRHGNEDQSYDCRLALCRVSDLPSLALNELHFLNDARMGRFINPDMLSLLYKFEKDTPTGREIIAKSEERLKVYESAMFTYCDEKDISSTYPNSCEIVSPYSNIKPEID